jgi:hypothetical protein
VSLQKYLINILVYIHCTVAAPPPVFPFMQIKTKTNVLSYVCPISWIYAYLVINCVFRCTYFWHWQLHTSYFLLRYLQICENNHSLNRIRNQWNQSAIILEMRIMCVLRNKQGNAFLLKALDEEGTTQK